MTVLAKEIQQDPTSTSSTAGRKSLSYSQLEPFAKAADPGTRTNTENR